ncbi:MAG: GMC family oxidoreductase N-terminal domain-containing protein [Burkholderiales bacterium]|nr:GMC family oxidoreductase N-terminal domain-containing protein [Burkholderiales bacterium]
MSRAVREFDYIVVGAGSSGCVLANRLSANARHSVLLLEAGGPDTSPWIHIPIGYGKTIFDRRINWGYETEPEPELGGRRIYWPRGKVLGGSGSVNGLVYIRGQREDFDGWAAQGNSGWGYDELLPYFCRSEHQVRGANAFHGNGGPLWVSDISEHHPLCDAFIASAGRLGIAHNPDFNAEHQQGAGYFQLTTRKGMRSSSATAYLRPARARRNLSVTTRALARRVLFQGRRAVGVEFERHGEIQMARARCEVLISGGAINSPQLLMLSGVGDASRLAAFGIAPVMQLPGVGRNLQDHLQARVVFKAKRAITYNDVFNSPLRTLQAGLQWLLLRRGPLTVSAGQAGAFVRVMPEARRPDVQFHLSTLSTDRPGEGLHKFPGFTASVCQLRPASRGHIELAGADPRLPPRIYANYLSAPGDRQVLREAVRLARQIAGTTPLADMIAAEFLPGTVGNDDAALDAFVRSKAVTIFHPVGTCAMGGSDDAVVDHELRVRGVERLRVIDASIMPTLISGNTNAVAVAIGEKGADLVLGERG